MRTYARTHLKISTVGHPESRSSLTAVESAVESAAESTAESVAKSAAEPVAAAFSGRPEMPEAAAFRQQVLNAMSHAACTVSVVTTDGPAGRFGLTITAMSSVSAEGPAPTLLVCINERSSAIDGLLANGVFCVNVLRDDQSGIADTFAGRGADPAPDRFAGTLWTTERTGAPRLVDPLVAFDCRVLHTERIGSHFVVVGAIEAVFVAPAGGAPLIYANRAYGTAQPMVRAPRP